MRPNKVETPTVGAVEASNLSVTFEETNASTHNRE
ncbi:hypothetical protein Xhom_03255 [Xenorhabdus hominickii]|uniref:Uncharacterized protein n=1 Tax=Xenorhabdus hominickii TaxID=351679 RepID=A0A2G0Q4N0_XENHO|nr:hypothetical protein Xhom_03255 [Xenorhabdus hominickii]